MVSFDNRLSHNQQRYYVRRVLTVVGGAVVRAIVSLNVVADSATEVLAVGRVGDQPRRRPLRCARRLLSLGRALAELPAHGGGAEGARLATAGP